MTSRTPPPADAAAPSFRVVIPARYASHRLPGKPLADIAGRPLVMHVWDRAQSAGATEVFVATDDERVARAVDELGGRSILTSKQHASGTDRLAQVAADLAWEPDAVVVNVQGDEPLVPPELVRGLASTLQGRPRAAVATLATPIRSVADLWSTNVVKVVCDADGRASYFSRAPIPWARDAFAEGRPEELPGGVPYLRHIGLYAYRVSTLRKLTAAEPAPQERAESLEQLRALHLGFEIHVSVVDSAPPHGVDTPEDLDRVRRVLEAG